MGQRVLATERAAAAAREMAGLIDSAVAQLSTVRRLGQTLSDPSAWDGPLAADFRSRRWPGLCSAIDGTVAHLHRLQESSRSVIDAILGAGGEDSGEQVVLAALVKPSPLPSPPYVGPYPPPASDPGPALRRLAQTVPNVQDQYRHVVESPLLEEIRKHPDAVRQAGLLALDHELFGPGGPLYVTDWGSWLPYGSLQLKPGSTAAWSQAVDPNNVCLPIPYEYGGGGFISGPDGRKYPLVVPTAQVDGKAYTGDYPYVPASRDLESLDGHDPGWTTIYYRDGTDDFGPRTTIADRVAAGLVGLDGIDVGSYPDSLQQQLSAGPGGYPTVGPSPGAPEPPAPPVMWDQRYRWMPLGGGRWGWVDAETYQPSREVLQRYPSVFGPRDPEVAASAAAAERGDAALGGGQLALSTLQGLAAAAELGDNSLRYYTVAFQENPDGRVRAILRTYSATIGTDDKGSPIIQVAPYSMYVGPDGTMQNPLMHYRGRLTGPPHPEIEPARPPYEVVGQDGSS